jgi:hypothetical protein
MNILTEPSSASIPACGWNYGKFYVNISQDHQTAIVQGHMGSRNSSGRMLQGHWKVKLKNNGKRGWAAVRVKIDG